jgi:hypothetical protein
MGIWKRLLNWTKVFLIKRKQIFLFLFFFAVVGFRMSEPKKQFGIPFLGDSYRCGK